jgi:hypothetical protein
MPLNKNPYILAAKLAILVWGVISLMQGAGLSFFISGAHQDRQIAFIALVYDSVFVASLISLLSSRLAWLILFGAAVAAIAILFWTNFFGHGREYAPALVLSIATRPVLGSLLFFLIAHYEKRLPTQA